MPSPPKNFEAVVRRHHQDLFRQAMSLVNNEPEAIDLTQQTFLEFATSGHQLHDPTEVKNWLFHTLKSNCSDQHASTDLASNIEVPADLEQNILAAAGMERPRFQRLAMAITAAAIVLASAFTILTLQNPARSQTFANFRDDMVRIIASKFDLDLATDKIAIAKQHLETKGYPTFSTTPEQIINLTSVGSKTIDWGEHKVSLITTRDPEDQLVHLFVIDRSVITDLDHLAAPLADTILTRGRQTVGWQDGQHLYLLVNSTPEVKSAPLSK